MPYVRKRGIGLYPDQQCYDPTRPNWLPYWIDTPSESGCKFGLYPTVTTLGPIPAPPTPGAPAAPQTQPEMTTPGAFNPSTAGIDWNGFQSSVQNFFNQLGSSSQFGGPCDPTQATLTDPSSWCFSQWLVAGAVGLIAYLLLTQPRGGRR